MRLCAAILLVAASATASASTYAVFPSVSEAVGASFPPVDISRMNQRLAIEVLERFRFDETWREIVAGKVRASMLAARKEECGGKLGDEQTFIISAFVQGKYNSDILESVDKSNAIIRAREYLIYLPAIREDQYAELRQVEPGPLVRSFVVEWLMRDYRYQAPVDKLARLTLKALCAQ